MKTNGFSTFSAWRLQKPMVFQHFEPKSSQNQMFFGGFGVRPGPRPGPGPAPGQRELTGRGRQPTGLGGLGRQGLQGQAGPDRAPIGRARQAIGNLWSRKAPQTTGWGQQRHLAYTARGVAGGCHCVGGRAPSAPMKSFKQASNPHGNTHIHRQANTNEWTRPAKAQSVGSGGGEM